MECSLGVKVTVRSESTEAYDMVRMALISCRERFRNMMLHIDTDNAQLVIWQREQAIAGFKEVDAILADPKSSE